MSIRLRELVRNVRQCKTAADERTVVSKEGALIRTAFREDDLEYRARNVSKLLYIHMLGYPAHFGQIECLKLIASPKYADKRIGYLGLMLLLDERQEVLMLVTNSAKNDMSHPNQYIAGLALSAIGNIASSEMSRVLAPEVERLLGSTNPYLRKKAALCATRILRKVPEFIENFIPRASSMLSEKNHGVLLSALALIIEMCEANSSTIEHFRKTVPQLVIILKSLTSSGYAPGHDVSGITDPFLQVKILKLLRIVGKGHPESSEAMSDILAQVATNTESSRNVGNAILYECVQTIMGIESESGLRVLAINILGRFLLNRDNNIRYVALNTLSKVVSADLQAVQRHRNTIVDCLKDPDISIRRRALDLIYALINESNIRLLTKELLNYLAVADVEFKENLTTKLCMVIEKYAPNRRWHVDTILRVLKVAGNYVRDEIPSNLILLISAIEDLQGYAVQKLYVALKEDITQQTLLQIGAWCIGEYGDILLTGQGAGGGEEDEPPIKATESDVLDLLEKILHHSNTSSSTREYVITALMKLSTRFVQSVLRIKELIGLYESSINLELQSRAVEYMKIYPNDSLRNALFSRMPAPSDEQIKKRFQDDSIAAEAAAQGDNKPSEVKQIDASSVASIPQTNKQISNPLDDLLKLTSDTPSVPAFTPQVDLQKLFSGNMAVTPPSAATPFVPAQPSISDNNIFNLFNPAPIMPVGANNSFPVITAYQNNGLVITFAFEKPSPTNININITFTNSNPSPLLNFTFLAAVPKIYKLTMEPPSNTIVPALNNGKVTQVVKVINNAPEQQKPLAVRIKITYTINGQPVSEQAEVNNLPFGL